MRLSKIFFSFFIFGLVNNVLYVVILTAAHDLVSPATPKSLILLADILPAFLLKLILPLLANDTNNRNNELKTNEGLGINYRLRLAIVVALSSIGMLLVSLNLPLEIILIGIVMASLSSGLGETTFLQLSHHYNNQNNVNASSTLGNDNSNNLPINGWSCGTGAAGLVGSGLVLLFTTIFNVPIKWVLICCTLFPFSHIWVFFCYLPCQPVHKLNSIPSSSMTLDEEVNLVHIETNESTFNENTNKSKFLSNILPKIKKYFFLYMVPLSLVYFAEYSINQGVAPTMLFPLDQTPFKTFRDSYVTYGTIYQIGVFISRSSGTLIRIKYLYLLGFLQFVNLVICILQSLYIVLPNIWIVFILIFYEGLLGGGAYVNTFIRVSEDVELSEREFALGWVGISDSFGIVLSAVISLWVEPTLCHYQIKDGRNWCTMK